MLTTLLFISSFLNNIPCLPSSLPSPFPQFFFPFTLLLTFCLVLCLVSSVYKFPVDFNLLKAEKQTSLSTTESNAAIYYLELNIYQLKFIHYPFIHLPYSYWASITYSFCVCSAYSYMSENFLLQLSFWIIMAKSYHCILKAKEYLAKVRNILGRKARK